MLQNKIFRSASFKTNLLSLLSSAAIIAAPCHGQIAARYRNDKGIEYDPAVILADDFESYTSPKQLTLNWTRAYQQPNLRIATEAGNFYAGAKALEMKLPISAKASLQCAH